MKLQRARYEKIAGQSINRANLGKLNLPALSVYIFQLIYTKRS